MTKPQPPQTLRASPAFLSPLAQDGWLQALSQPPVLHWATPLAGRPQVRLFRVAEINAQNHQDYRQALTNVYAQFAPGQPMRLLYLLQGSADGVALYFGAVTEGAQQDLHYSVQDLRSALEGQLPGVNFASVDSTEHSSLLDNLLRAPRQGVMLGTPTAEAAQEQPQQERNFQGLDRLVRTLQSCDQKGSTNASHWSLCIVSQPLDSAQVRQLLDEAYALSSRLALLARTSVQASSNTGEQKGVSTGNTDTHSYSEGSGTNAGESHTRGKNESASEGTSNGRSSSSNSSSSSSGTNSGTTQGKSWGTNTGTTTSTGTSTNENRSVSRATSETSSLNHSSGSTLGITQEVTDKRAEHLLEHIDKQLLARLHKGLTKGLFQSAIYLSADDQVTYQRLKNAARATFQGGESTHSPLQVFDLPKAQHGQQLRLPPHRADVAQPADWLFYSLLHDPRHGGLGSLVTADELAIIAGLPHSELQGIRRRKTVDFKVDVPRQDADNALDLGCVIDQGRHYPNNRIHLSRADLNKHVFVTGVTGAGKTTTCLNLLIESGLPFLVIEPAKTEYRELAAHLPGSIDYYRPNGDDHQSLRLNPFALVRPEQRIKSHAGFLKNVLTAVFPMEASMPAMVEAAILGAYEEKGWDIDENSYLPGGDPFDPLSRAWPTMSDMIRQLDAIIPNFGLGKEFAEKYRGSLVSRLRSLTDGTLGRVLDVPQSIDFSALVQRRAVIELEELQSGEEKAIMMALLLGVLNETMRQRHGQDRSFRQLTLIEEAHRLLSRPEPGDKAAALAVESFADMLAEVRKYGTGLIIADQIPAKLIPDVIKNTHAKIVHRLFAEDDRRAMGESMMMDDDERNFLPNLATGEAVVFCGGWHGAVHAAIRNDRARTDRPSTFELEPIAVEQLWRERARYYPQLCRLGWLTQEGAEPPERKVFADFVRQTRQGHSQLLRLADAGKNPAHAQMALRWLQAWQRDWQPLAEQGQGDYVQWRAAQADDWPQDLLTAAWLALMLDANPKIKPEIKNVGWSFASDQSFVTNALSY